MFGPIRNVYAHRAGASAGLLVSAAAVTVMFSATPFLIPEISARYGVSEGTVGLISLVQVGLFAAANFVLPRTGWQPEQVFRWSALLFALANVASIALSVFWSLMIVRAAAGAAAGALTWVAWGEAMRTPRSMTGVAATGPLTMIVAAPLMGVLAVFGDRTMYALLALTALPVVVLPVTLAPAGPSRRRVSRSRSNRLLLASLGMLTFFGASLFVFASVIARERLGLPPAVAGLAYSANAAAGFLGARWAGRHRRPGLWIMATGPAAAISVLGGNAMWYFVGMAFWGFAYWMGVPGVLRMLSDRSLEPAERAGDAQGLMAVGRSFGPVMGGSAVDAGLLTGLAAVVGVGMSLAGATVVGVEEGREHLPPTPLERLTPEREEPEGRATPRRSARRLRH